MTGASVIGASFTGLTLTLCSGACLLPIAPASFMVFSGELYIPNTSASASLVLMVIVGSAPPPIIILLLLVAPPPPVPVSLKFTRTEEWEEEEAMGGGASEGHFLPRRPMERARASCILYSWRSSVKRSERLNRHFSGRFPGTGGASITAYLDAGDELTNVDGGGEVVRELGRVDVDAARL